jgi:uncharacterized protein YfaS (alpha-2-macroglobulin family)
VYVLRWLARVWFGVLVAMVLLIGLLLVLRLILPMLSPSPALVQAAPPDGATAVTPRTRLSLRFNTPMNRPSVGSALQIEPPLEAILQWADDDRTLTISPTQSLLPDTTYRLTLDTRAHSRMFRSPDAPLAFGFRTAPAPAVLALLPPDGAQSVATNTPISIRFSRPIVPTDSLRLPAQLPELQLDPPASGSALWLDPSTVLFRPNSPFRPGTRYQATLRAGLTDLGGGELGRDVAWSFSTPPPDVLAIAPSAGERWLAPRAPLTIRLSQALDPAVVVANFSITPTVAGDFAFTTLPDATQAITFTPAVDWRAGASYLATLQLGPQASARWNFITAPPPAVIGRFPGEGQIVPLGQDIRLIFNTPVDAATLRDAIQLEPSAAALDVFAEGAEVRIAAKLSAATAYTLTLPSSLTDRNGISFGRGYQMRFTTAPAAPALQLLSSPAHIFQALPGDLRLPFRRTNLSALNLALYQLDQATTVRALAFAEADWLTFQPERYQQPSVRSWTLTLTDTLNTAVDDQLPLALADGQPLPPGVYYLRMLSPEGPRADLLLLVSRARLTLQSSDAGVVVWATDIISATPIGALPLVLYQDGALIERGTTDSNGLWRSGRAPASAARLQVLAEGASPALVSDSWNDNGVAGASGRARAWFTTDRAAYYPGERVALAGFVRRVAAQTIALPPKDVAIALAVRQLGAPEPLYRATVTPTGTGLISSSFTLPADAPPGDYVLGATIDGALFHTTFAVRTQEAPPLTALLSTPALVAAGEPAPIDLTVHALDGSPVASAAISWTLSVERQLFPRYLDYSFGDDELATALPEPRSGIGRTDAAGRYGMAITDTLAGPRPLRYRLLARASDIGGLEATAEATFTVAPADVYAGLRLPSRVLNAGERGRVEVVAVTPTGQPVAQANVEATIDRRVWQPVAADPLAPTRLVLQPDDRRVATLRGRTDRDGAAALPLTLRSGGEYRVRIAIVDAAGRRAISATTLWVAEPGFVDWRSRSEASERLIADRAAYQPGDTATLLLATPHTDGVALLTRARAGALTAETRPLRAGVPLTLTLSAEDAPEVRVALLANSPDSGAIGATLPMTLATTTLPVFVAERALQVAVAADRNAYAAGENATLVITTSNTAGVGVPAELILGVVGANAAPRHDASGSGRGPAEAFVSPAPAIATAQAPGLALALPPVLLPPASPLVDLPPPAQPGPLVYWNTSLRTSADGTLTMTLPLPDEPAELQALLWASSGAARFGQASASLIMTQPLELDIGTPDFFRVGDQVELAAFVANTSSVTQSAVVELSATDLQVTNASRSRSIEVAAGARVRVAWNVRVGTAARAVMKFTLRPGGASVVRRTIDRPIVPAGQPSPPSGDIGLLREYIDPSTNQPLDKGRLRNGQLVRVRVTVTTFSARRMLELDEPLPGGMTLIETPKASFAEVRRDTARLLLAAGELAPGIYQYSYLLRATSDGDYDLPPPTLQADGKRLGGGGPTRVTISTQS